MKVKITRTTRHEEEVEVDFPIYQKHDLMLDHAESIIYRRVDADLTYFQIHKTGADWRGSREAMFEIEIGKFALDTRDDPNYLLGRGDYASDSEEFEAIVAEASEFLGRFTAVR